MTDDLTTTTTVSTVPSGTVIATDDAGGAHIQLIKLVDGTADSTTVIPGDGSGLQVQGQVADDAVAAGNPVLAAAKAKAFDGTDPSAVAENDAGVLVSDLNRRLYVNTAHPNWFNGNENNSTAQTDNPIVAAPGASLSLYVQSVVMSTDTAMNIKLVEDTAAAAVIAGPYYFAANGGLAFTFDPPLQLTANKDLGYTSSAAGNHTVTVTGFTGP